MTKEKIMFVSVRNASRTQMAEGFGKAFYGDEFDIYSAGSDPQEIDPTTIQIMDDIGINISKQTSNTLMDFKDLEIDYIIMICGNEYDVCPIFMGGKNYFKKQFNDIYPNKGTEKINILREIRDDIGDWIQDFHYYMNDEGKTLTISECCDLLDADGGCCDLKGVEKTSCCDTGETESNCCNLESSDPVKK